MIYSKFFTLILFLFGMSLFSFSQVLMLDWARTEGGAEIDYALGVTTDNDGNVYTVGRYTAEAVFDEGSQSSTLYASGLFDGFVQKISADGIHQWTRSIGDVLGDETKDVAVGPDGNVYTLSESYQDNTGRDLILRKFSSMGNQVWSKRMSGSLSAGNSLEVSETGEIYIAGGYNWSMNYQGGHSSNGSDDIFVMKLNSMGNKIWSKSIGGGGSDNAFSLDVDEFGAVYIMGEFSDNVDFDPGSSEYILGSGNLCYDHTFIEKLDTDGNFEWVKAYDGNVYGKSISISPDGHLYVTGKFSSEFYGAYPKLGGTDVFALKYDLDGDFQWIKTLGGSGNEEKARSIEADANGNVYVSGEYYLKMDADPSSLYEPLQSNGLIDGFVVKLSSEGEYIDSRSFGGENSSESINDLAIDLDGNLIVVGQHRGFEYDALSGELVDLPTNGTTEILVMKFRQEPIYSICPPYTNELYVYPNPFKDNFSVVFGESEVRSVSITNVAGQLVYSEQLEEGLGGLSLNLELRAGLYRLEVVTADDVHLLDLVKY